MRQRLHRNDVVRRSADHHRRRTMELLRQQLTTQLFGSGQEKVRQRLRLRVRVRQRLRLRVRVRLRVRQRLHWHRHAPALACLQSP